MSRKLFIVILIFFGISLAIILLFMDNQNSEVDAPIIRTNTPSSSEALSSCNIDLQSSVMNVNRIPNWSDLGISTCYQLALVIDPTNSKYQAKAHITTSNLTDFDLPDLVFRLYPNASAIYGGKIGINTVELNGQLIDFQFFLENTALKIEPPQPIKPGHTLVIEFDYFVELPQDFSSQHVYGIFTHSIKERILTLANWFPMLAAHQDDKWSVGKIDGIGDAVTSDTALFLVEITTPREWSVITTGMEINTSDFQDALTHHFVSGPTRDFMVVASPSLDAETRIVDDLKIQQWGNSETKISWDLALNVARASVETFSHYYGQYPFKEIDIVAVPLNLAVGVEYPGLILISEKDYQDNPDAANELMVVIAHEIAHQWWYSIVGNDVSSNPWQDEALTTFSTYDFLKTYNPGIYQYLRNSYNQRVAAYQQANGNQSFMQPVSAFTTQPSAYSTLVYVKGALFFDALRSKLGDNAFNNALRSYYTQNEYKIASPNDLLDVFSSSCNCDLTDFYLQWGLSR